MNYLQTKSDTYCTVYNVVYNKAKSQTSFFFTYYNYICWVFQIDSDAGGFHFLQQPKEKRAKILTVLDFGSSTSAISAREKWNILREYWTFVYDLIQLMKEIGLLVTMGTIVRRSISFHFIFNLWPFAITCDFSLEIVTSKQV